MPTRVSSNRLLEILDSLDYHLALYDREWRYVYVNTEAARVLDRTPDELLGRSIWELFPDAVGNQYYRELHDALATGEPVHSDHFYAAFDRWFENHIYPVPDGVLVLARDVTTERRAAEALRDREDMLRMAQRAGGVATFLWDFTNLIADCSPEFFRIFGLPGREGTITAAEWGTFVHPDDRDRMTDHLARAIAGLEPPTADYRIIAADGRQRWLTYAAEIQRTRVGDRMLGTVVDITERKRLEGQLREANQMKDQFLASLSHELRTPLNAILGYATLLRRGDIAPENRTRALEIIERNAISQSRLLEDLLDMSRMGTHKVRLERAPVSVEAVLGDAVDAVAPTAGARSITIALDVSPGMGLVCADATRLQQVFWNLLSNAVKFSPEGGVVTVQGRADERHVEVAVIDTGAGIAPEFLPRIFEPFTQAHSGFARARGGLGLGLAISVQLVEMHGGTIQAASLGEGQGSTFVVRLPRDTSAS